jgi:glucose-1-phosphate thymidylyltransferase
MTDMKIIIPMAGIGKRLGKLTQHKPKALVRLADKRLLGHVLNSFQELEKTYTLEYIFVIGYLGEQIKEYMKEAYPEKNVTYYVQEQLMGQSHAVYLAKDSISGPILLTFCDTINVTNFSFLPLGTIDGVVSVREVDDPRRHGVAVVGPDNLLTKLVEKPRTMEHKSALTGLYYFSEGKELVKAIETQMRRGTSLNNEYYLADAINILVEGGMRIRTEKVLQWLDAGTPEAVIETNAYLLQHHTNYHREIVAGQTNVLIHPVFIHESSSIQNSIIGPNVSIGENCSISGSIIKNSIVDDDSNVTGLSLVNSLIGKGCSVSGNPMQSIVADHDERRIYYAADKTKRSEQAHASFGGSLESPTS